MTTKEMIAVMQAYKDGKEIEFKARGTYSNWQMACSPNWNWDYADYRVKPEEKQKVTLYEYMYLNADGLWLLVNTLFSNDTDARSWIGTGEEAFQKTGRSFEVEVD